MMENEDDPLGFDDEFGGGGFDGANDTIITEPIEAPPQPSTYNNTNDNSKAAVASSLLASLTGEFGNNDDNNDNMFGQEDDEEEELPPFATDTEKEIQHDNDDNNVILQGVQELSMNPTQSPVPEDKLFPDNGIVEENLSMMTRTQHQENAVQKTTGNLDALLLGGNQNEEQPLFGNNNEADQEEEKSSGRLFDDDDDEEDGLFDTIDVTNSTNKNDELFGTSTSDQKEGTPLFENDDDNILPDPTITSALSNNRMNHDNNINETNGYGDLFGDNQMKIPSSLKATSSSNNNVTDRKLESAGLLSSPSENNNTNGINNTSSNDLFGDCPDPIDDTHQQQEGGGLFDEIDAQEEKERKQKLLKERQEQEAKRHKEQQELMERERQMQQQAMSIPPPSSHPPPPPPNNNNTNSIEESSFYRNHDPGLMTGRYGNNMIDPIVPNTEQPSSYNNNNKAKSIQPHPKEDLKPSLLAGLYNGGGSKQKQTNTLLEIINTSKSLLVTDFDPVYGKITVDNPKLTQQSGLLPFNGGPYWTYTITTYPKEGHPGSKIIVYRRFSHCVALEKRLRDAYPGAILPPKPDKHDGRIIEEGLQQQSAQFVAQRAIELQNYLGELAQHPIVGDSEILRLFLTLQDHIGCAWPEVSSSAITRLGHATGKTTSKIVSSLPQGGVGQFDPHEAEENNAELLAWATFENVRVNAVVQSVIKVEYAFHLLRELGQISMSLGLELTKLCKLPIINQDTEFIIPLDLLAIGAMKSGKRTKQQSLQLMAAVVPFVFEYRQCKYVRMAFNDRRDSLHNKQLAKAKALMRSDRLIQQQKYHLNASASSSINHHQGEYNFSMDTLEKMEMEAAVGDETYLKTVEEAEKTGKVLISELCRISARRNKEWKDSIKIMASSFKESCSERVAIWENIKHKMEQTFSNTDEEQGQGQQGQAAEPVVHVIDVNDFQ